MRTRTGIPPADQVMQAGGFRRAMAVRHWLDPLLFRGTVDSRAWHACGAPTSRQFQVYDDACLPVVTASHVAGMEINAVNLGVKRTDPGAPSW